VVGAGGSKDWHNLWCHSIRRAIISPTNVSTIYTCCLPGLLKSSLETWCTCFLNITLHRPLVRFGMAWSVLLANFISARLGTPLELAVWKFSHQKQRHQSTFIPCLMYQLMMICFNGLSYADSQRCARSCLVTGMPSTTRTSPSSDSSARMDPAHNQLDREVAVIHFGSCVLCLLIQKAAHLIS